MMYHLCSEDVIKTFPEVTRSDPFKSGYDYDANTNFYVIKISSEELVKIHKYYIEKVKPLEDSEPVDFWTRPIIDSQLDFAKNCSASIRRIGLFRTIEQMYGLTQMYNVAYAIHKIAVKYNLDPINFINNIVCVK